MFGPLQSQKRLLRLIPALRTRKLLTLKQKLNKRRKALIFQHLSLFQIKERKFQPKSLIYKNRSNKKTLKSKKTQSLLKFQTFRQKMMPNTKRQSTRLPSSRLSWQPWRSSNLRKISKKSSQSKLLLRQQLPKQLQPNLQKKQPQFKRSLMICSKNSVEN